MKKIGLFFFGKINALTGASTVLRNLISGFKDDKNFDLYTYMLDVNGEYVPIYDSKQNKVVTKHRRQSFRLWVHKFLKEKSKVNLMVARLYAWLSYERNSKIVVGRYGNMIKDLDVLFFHEITTPYFLRQKYPKEWKDKKKVIVLHNNGEVLKMFFSNFPLLQKNNKTRLFYQKQVRVVLNDMDKIVFLSDFAKHNFVKLNPEYENKTEVVPNGLNISSNMSFDDKNKNKITITTVGTVCERKGHDIIVETLISMTKEQRDLFEVIVVGGGGILEKLKEECLNNEVENIKFIGSSTNVSMYLQKSDVFLLASRDEGLPMAIIEAMAYDLPILATNVGGIPDLIQNEKSGWLIEPNAKSLKNILMRIIGGEYDLEAMGKESKQMYLNNYTQRKMIEGYKNIFNQL